MFGKAVKYTLIFTATLNGYIVSSILQKVRMVK
jgi:hypothetical protein